MNDTEYDGQLSESHCKLEDGMVVFRITGPVDDALGITLEACGTKFLDEDAADRVLIDLSGSSSFSVKSRIRWVGFLKHPRIYRAAIFGGEPLVRVLANVMIKLSQRKNIQYFQSEESARSWLVS